MMPMSASGDNVALLHRRLVKLVQCIDLQIVGTFAEQILRTACNEGTIFLFGNGGSAALAMHLVADLTRVSQLEKRQFSFRTRSLCGEGPALTGLANDFGYEEVFRRQIEHVLSDLDLLVGISSSGQSRNVLLALEFGADRGSTCLGMTGRNGSALVDLCDAAFVVDSLEAGIIESVHLCFSQLVVASLST